MRKRRKQKLENKVNWEFAATWHYTSDCSNILLCKLDLWNGQCLDQGTLGQDGHCPLRRYPSGASSAGSDNRLGLSPTHLMNKINAGQNHLEIEFKSCSFSAFSLTFFPSLPPSNTLYRVYILLIFLFKLLAKIRLCMSKCSKKSTNLCWNKRPRSYQCFPSDKATPANAAWQADRLCCTTGHYALATLVQTETGKSKQLCFLSRLAGGQQQDTCSESFKKCHISALKPCPVQALRVCCRTKPSSLFLGRA